MQFSWRAGNVSNTFRFCNGTRIDPFGSAPDSAFGQAVVDYYWQVVAPVNQPIYAIFNVTNIYTSFWNELMMDEDYRPAGLAVVGAIMQRVANPDRGTSVDVACHRASAMSRLRRKCQDAMATGRQVIDDMTIITVLALANLARFLGDTRSYETHRRMMKDMVYARGGLDSLGQGGLAKVVLLQWDSFWIFETDGAPLFSDARPEHVPVYPAFPLCGDLRETFVKLPVGFQSLILKGKLSVETIEILDRVIDVIDDGLDSIANWNMNHSNLRKYSDFVEACPCLTTSDAEKTTIEKDICLALFLYCFSTFTIARSNTSLYVAARAELTRLLLRADHTTYSQPEQECLFWTCIICIDSWRKNASNTVLLPKAHLLLPILSRLKRDVATDNTLQKFLFNHELAAACENYIAMAG